MPINRKEIATFGFCSAIIFIYAFFSYAAYKKLYKESEK